MRDHPAQAGDDLDALALLYANGEMDASQAAAFERLLGEDQRAREALCLAVELSRTLDGLPAPAPDPAYRAAVRGRLLPQRVLARLTARRYRGHPVLWAALGAAAVYLGVVVTNALFPPQTAPVARAPGSPIAVPAPDLAKANQQEFEEAARLWSELPKHERIIRLREEEQQRKARPDDVRLARNEERGNRVLVEPPMPRP